MDQQMTELVDYIRSQETIGYTHEMIRQVLLGSGWNDGMISQAFSVAALPSGPAVPALPGTKTHTGFRLRYIIVLFVAMVVVASGVGILLHHSSSKKPETAKQTSTSSSSSSQTSGLKANADNVSRKNDVSAIAAGIENYISNNSGTLPLAAGTGKTSADLEICGSDCGSGNKEAVTLQHYKAAAVSFRAYQDKLAVPDAETVYIVNYATCNSNGTALVASNNRRDVALLYAITSDDGPYQECLSD